MRLPAIQLLLFVFVLHGAAAQQVKELDERAPTWQGLEQALAKADVNGKLILVDVFAPWCGWCRRLQSEVYTQDEVLDYIDTHFEIARLNIDVADDKVSYKGYELSQAELASAFGAQGTPTTIFLDRTGDYITRLPGFVNADQFLDVLSYIGSGAFERTTFEQFVENQHEKP